MSRKQDKNALKNNVCAEVMLALVLKKRIWRWASLGLLCFGYLLLQTCSGDQTKAWNVPHIAQVAIEGPIQSVSQDWYQQLLKVESSKTATGLVLVVNSPGGVVHVAEAGYKLLMRIRNKGIPIVTVVKAQATSAAYLLAVTSHSIIANNTSIVGSIGVKSSVTVFKELLGNIGVNVNKIGVGEGLTQIPFQGISAFTKKYLDMSGEDSYIWFKRIVQQGRRLSDIELDAVVGGRVFTGKSSKQLRLIDHIGGIDDAYAMVKQHPANRLVMAQVVDYSTVMQ